MFHWDSGLKLAETDVYFDAREPRTRCIISHAHSDHLAIHANAWATPATAAIARHRVGPFAVTDLPFDTPIEIAPDLKLTLIPAGHVLGSAMAHVQNPDGTLLYTGDFKLRTSLTVEQAQPRPADELIMETTYGQPFFRFPCWQLVAEEMIELVRSAIAYGRQPIVMGYSLGKAQEITRILTDVGLPVTLHGAVWAMHHFYGQFGISPGPVRRYAPEDFHGPSALDLTERGVIVAPPNVARSPFTLRFKDPLRIVMTGWALAKNAKFRYGVDHALPLSDHADFDELIELVERVHPQKIYTCHGYREFADVLRQRGWDASPAEPDRQLSLFAD